MQLEICLKKVLQQCGLNERGITQRMARDLKLHRHTIGKLYRSQAANPSLDVLGKVCDWLEHHGVPGTILPQALLGVRPSHLWAAVAAPRAVTLYVGEYHHMPPGPRPFRWIAQHDALAMAKIVQSLSSSTDIAERRVPVGIEYVPFRFDPANPALSDTYLGEDEKRARQIFTALRAPGRAASAIILGSQRANHLVELLVADLFGRKPFCPPSRAADMVPFYLAFRTDDRGVRSCFGGHTAPLGCRRPVEPGVYYRGKHGWSVCPWERGARDAGVLLLARDKGTAALEMAVIGFSGPATEALVEELLSGPDRFWPPLTEVNGKEIGVHICRVVLTDVTSGGREKEVRAKDVEVIPLEPDTLREHIR